MAVAGLYNVLAYSPPFFEKPQPSTRASSLLQMWREIESEHVAGHSPRPRPLKSDVSDSDQLSTITSDGQRSDKGDYSSEDASEVENQGRMRLENDYEDSNSTISEQSIDFGEFERERVRQIFREWMNCGAKSHSATGLCMDKQSGPQWLAENECERVRVIREWVQKNTQQGSSCGSCRDGDSEIGSQFEQVRDGLAVNHSEVGARRPIQRLCGRQTLLDLLLRAEQERRRELQGLSEQRPVSDFAHRNRIQALLRGRFLRNERLISDERPCSIAATELGMLSQRHAVSELREGFLSRLDNSAQILMNSNNEHMDEHEVINGKSRPTFRERDTTMILPAGDSERGTHENITQQEFVVECTSEVEEPVLDNEETLQEASTEEVERARSRHGIEINDTGTTMDGIANERSMENVDVDGGEHLEVFAENYEHRTEVNYAHEVAGYSNNVERNANEEFDWEDSSAQLDRLRERVIENEESSWQQLTGIPFSEWADDRGWQGNSANQRFQETSGNGVERVQMQESHEDWQEALGSRLDVPSGEDNASIGRDGRVYFPDDDNVYSMELREVFSRRRVSSLLRSGFRESLSQVLQSHLERQGHASSDWELDNASSSLAPTEQVEEQINGDQDLAQDGTERNPFVFSSPFGNGLQQLSDEELQDANWPCNSSSQRLGIDWDVINELRVDMARLQHRMDNMQRMLEACMDMQIELQRTLRQEVSAALNRSNLSTDKLEGTVPINECQWNHVKKGICCLCHDSHIDSLLNRCGHICTCSKCAQKLVQSTGKCPLCQAPVIEVVQAYFIQ
ncbi:E3 ubiquitin ligase [Olea europaea subsp. europaea]|uniref:E3 ubiquitin ligase n=2 Tax=Olea europaea subsp. europaea TaxID=158383 RepID=A0A8S0QF85_OLEEU|nr:E3 ubiquitin ligase [Olea europaea subsp. europaea]